MMARNRLGTNVRATGSAERDQRPDAADCGRGSTDAARRPTSAHDRHPQGNGASCARLPSV
jgi:hypothetical protein